MSKAFLLFLIFLQCRMLAHSQEINLVLPVGHTNDINSAAFSTDGKKIVTASADKSVKIWESATGRLLLDIKEQPSFLRLASFNPNGDRILAVCDDTTAKIWNAETGKLLFNLRGHTQGLTAASFSKDGKKVVTASWDKTAKIWDAATGKLLANLKDHTQSLTSAVFSNDGKKIATCSYDRTAKIWNVLTGKLLFDCKGHQSAVGSVVFSPDGKKIVTASTDATAMLWDAETGHFLLTLKGHTNGVMSAVFNRDGKKILTASWDKSARVWDALSGKLLLNLNSQYSAFSHAEFNPGGDKILTIAEYQNGISIWNAVTGVLLMNIKGNGRGQGSGSFNSDGSKFIFSASSVPRVWDMASGKLLFDLKTHSSRMVLAVYSKDGKKLVTASAAKAMVWDVQTGSLLLNLEGHTSNIQLLSISDDTRKIATLSQDGTVKVWDAQTGTALFSLKDYKWAISLVAFSPDGSKIVTVLNALVTIWNAQTGILLHNLNGHGNHVNFAAFSPDGEKLSTASVDNTAKLWDTETGKLLFDFKGHSSILNAAPFSPDGKKIVTASWDSTVKVWDTQTGKLLFDLKGMMGVVNTVSFSPDGKKIFASSSVKTKVWATETGAPLFELGGYASFINAAAFSAGGNQIVTAVTDRNIAKIWDAENGNLLFDLKGHTQRITSVTFNPAGKRIATTSWDNTVRIIDAATADLLYSFIAIDSADYLIVDKDYHYDGTPGARKFLYFTCGSEIVDLEQVKESLWVPDLAERINRGEPINNQKLSELDLCGFTPLVSSKKAAGDSYSFSIVPRRGGLGNSYLIVNGNTTGRYSSTQLKKTTAGYELNISKKEIAPYFIKGKENTVFVKAYTAANNISSRGGEVTVENNDKVTAAPNLYAVIVGINNYKAKELQLNYASKDAQDIGSTLGAASRKLLNGDGKEHVFIYNFNNGENRYNYPEKLNIRQVFDTIGAKSTANDILLFFFAGHGVVQGAGKKQFYFLTSDAASFNNVTTGGISTEELIDWIRPEKIKAQKRILILDACNSGEAINELSKTASLMAVRNNDAAETKKEIERLNDQAGMFILSASASNQSAYEFGRYAQGLLTYSLLKVIKLQPDILEDKKYLNLSRWFNAAKRSVNEIMNQSGNRGRQDPQLIANTDYNIGIVDADILDKIKLPEEKTLFSRTEFRNIDAHIDNIKLRAITDKTLSDVSSGKIPGDILYDADYEGSEAYSFSGDYKITGDSISISVFLIRGGSQVINNDAWQLKGTVEQLQALANEIVRKGIAAVKTGVGK